MSSSIKTPSRRMTLGVIPSGKPSTRHDHVDPSVATAITANAQSDITNNGINNKKPPRSRKSMLPRIDRENNPNNVSPSPESSLLKPTAASRRRSVAPGESRRASVAPGENHRMSMIPPSAPAATTKVDPRPASDKAFQQQCIKDLLAFLLECGYEYPISQKSLSRPSAKDFTSIVTFMLRLVDPNFQRGEAKFEDEVSTSFRCLGYPYTISKTALIAAGSTHTWPNLLAALAWLMDQIKPKLSDVEEDDEDKPVHSLLELEEKSESAFFKYLSKSYVAFMRNDVQHTEQLEDDFAERFERDDAYLTQEVERVTDLNAAIIERINELNQHAQELPDYARKREEYATDLEQFHDLIRQMNVHKNTLEQQVKERSNTLMQTNEKLLRLNNHIENLKQTVETQPLSLNDLQMLESESKGIQDAIDRFSIVSQQRRAALLAAEDELREACCSIESLIAEHNAKLLELQAISEQPLDLSPLKACFNKQRLLDADQSKIVGIDIHGSAIDTIESLMIDFQAKHDITKASYEDCLDKLEKAKEQCQESESKLNIVLEKSSKCMKTLESDQEMHNAKIGVRQRELDAMEAKVATRRDPVALEEQMAAYERQCTELEALRAQHEEENIATLVAVQEEIDQACHLMMQHEDFFRKKLKELDDYWQEKEAKMARVVLPANLQIDLDTTK